MFSFVLLVVLVVVVLLGRLAPKLLEPPSDLQRFFFNCSLICAHNFCVGRRRHQVEGGVQRLGAWHGLHLISHC